MIPARRPARVSRPSLVAGLALAVACSTGTTTGAVLRSIAVTPTNPVIARGTSTQLTATGTYSDNSTRDVTAQAAWTSSDPTTASVSGQGLVSGAVAGGVTVSAVVSGVTGTTSVTVTPATLVSVAVTPTRPSIAAGTTVQFTATGTYSDSSTQDLSGQVQWSSSDTAKASISGSGLATGVAPGPTTVSAAIAGKGGSTLLLVTPALLVSVSVTPASPPLPVGLTQQFTATGTYSDGTTQDLTGQVAWTSSDTTKASISGSGLATGVAAGPTTISATTSGHTGTAMLTITPATLLSIAVTPASPSIAAGTVQQFVATGTFSDNSKQDLTGQATWASSDPARAAISNAAGSRGLATSLVPGTTTISAAQAGITGATLLTVTPATLTALAVTPANPSIANGTSQQFVATGTYSDKSSQDLTNQVTWASDSASATVSNASGSRGLATAVGVGTATISAAFSGRTGTSVLTVTPAVLVSIAVSPTNASIANGTTRQFTATGTYSDGSTQDLTGQVSWASSNSALVAVSNASGSKGLAIALGVGGAAVSGTLSGKTGSASLTVTPATLVSVAVTPPARSMPAG
ncbi:MAG TPA: Ig-like domain-containing protein, partial [Kineosporiaceae bacterium]|nr:Ig-like domain-containing protein [Kineosporiaceae bacterium]